MLTSKSLLFTSWRLSKISWSKNDITLAIRNISENILLLDNLRLTFRSPRLFSSNFISRKCNQNTHTKNLSRVHGLSILAAIYFKKKLTNEKWRIWWINPGELNILLNFMYIQSFTLKVTWRLFKQSIT